MRSMVRIDATITCTCCSRGGKPARAFGSPAVHVIIARRLLLSLLALFPMAGCNPLIAGKRAIQEIKGASADVLPIVNARAFRGFGDIKLTSVKSDIGPLCPPKYLNALKTEFMDQHAKLREDRFHNGSGVVNVDITTTYFQKGGMAAVLGKDSICVNRIRLSDGGGTPLADLLVVGESSAMRTSESDLARAVIAELAKYLIEAR